MAFRKWKEKVIKKEIIIKCSFCKTNNSVGKMGNNYYCSDNKCANKFWKTQNINN